MKKYLALILAFLMIMALFTACSKDQDTTPVNSPVSSPAPSQASSPAEPAASSPAPTPTPPPVVTAAPGGETSDLEAPKASVIQHDGVGFYTDDVDWFARPAYKFAYISSNWMFIHELCAQAFQEWGKKLNFEFTSYDAGGDMNAFFAACESYAGMGYDGLFIDPDPEVAYRTIEFCDELGITYMPVINPLVDNDTRQYLAPGVTLDAYNMGILQAQWLIDNYRNYWPDVEPEEIGFLFMYVNFNENLRANMEGARDTFAKAYPQIADSNFFAGDVAAYSFDAQGGLEYSSTFITSHSEIKYWWISGCIEDLGQGGVRAAEDLNIESNVLVVTNGANWLIQDWDNGYDGCWKAGTYYAYPIFMEPLACGMIALIEGRTTYETIWGTQWIPAGQKYPVYPIETMLVTKDNYQAYLDRIASYIQ